MSPSWFKTFLREEANTWTSSSGNISVPNLQQVVTRGKSYSNRIVPVNKDGEEDLEAARAKKEANEAFEKECRDIVMESVNSGLINKALISALFLNFNIPSLLAPPPSFNPVNITDATFLIFFLSAAGAIASGFFCILSATFIATHAKAAQITQTMALTFSDSMAFYILLNHNVFLMQGLLTSTQVAAVCVSYMQNNWAVWLAIAFCVLSLIMVSFVKKAVNFAWVSALEADEIKRRE
jgi:hypothetical protein